MVILKKDNIKLEILKMGAEIKSFKIDEEEFLWNKQEYWAKTSPILFPFVGAIIDGKYEYKGKEYEVKTRHGFARDYEFDVVKQSDEEVIFKFSSNEETYLKYPFEFELFVKYILVDNGFKLSYKVINKGNDEMYFSIGAHPAFHLDGNFESDWELIFEKEENSKKYHLTEKNNFCGFEPFFENLEKKDRFNIKDDYFKNDAIAFKDLKSESVMLKNSKTGKEIKVNFKGFPYIGFWKVLEAPFLCIEPWYGITDIEDRPRKLVEKEGINRLLSKEEFNADLEFLFKKGK